MYEGCQVELRGIKGYLKDDESYSKIFQCIISKYVPNDDEIYMVVENAELSEISLDMKYDCSIWDVDGVKSCNGRVMERYVTKRGNNLRFRIENGFYKNNLN